MKITNFQLVLRQAATENGYGDNYYVDIDENGVTSVSHPYKSISHKELAAIFKVIQNTISKYDELVKLCDAKNRALKLEEYAPIVSSEEIASETDEVLAVPQSCALGGGETSRGAEVEIKDAPFEKAETEANGDIDESKHERPLYEGTF